MHISSVGKPEWKRSLEDLSKQVILEWILEKEGWKLQLDSYGSE